MQLNLSARLMQINFADDIVKSICSHWNRIVELVEFTLVLVLVVSRPEADNHHNSVIYYNAFTRITMSDFCLAS